MQVYYPNPFIMVLETEKSFVIRNGFKFEKILDKKIYSHFINCFQNQEAISMRELEIIFSQSEMVELFSSHILLDYRLELSSAFSRNNGYFSLTTSSVSYQELKEKRLLILGAGAIGTHIVWQLCAMGIKHLTILDFDQIELSNLNRQLLYRHIDIDRNKVDVLKEQLEAIFPEVLIEIIHQKLYHIKDVREVIKSDFDLVVKAIDTPEEMTEWVGQVAFENKVSMVQGGFIGTTGVVGPNYIPEKTPCYHCYQQDMKVTRLSGIGATQSSLTELVAGKMGLDILSILQNQTTAYSEVYEFSDGTTNETRTIKPNLIGKCTVCGRNNSVQKDLPKILDILYLIIVFVMPIIVTLNQLDARYNLSGLAISCILFTIIQKNEQKNFQLQFQAALTYVISLSILNIFLGITSINFSQWLISLVQIGLQEILLITVSVMMFESISYITMLVKSLLIRHNV
ncbi:hypothetical protein RyT2_03620 [Pseudolactococcus yaeyamensis]